jgi:signal transduction histidine kinase
MGAIDSVSATGAAPPPGNRAGGPTGLVRALLLAPSTRRARLEVLFCLAGIPLGLCVLVVPYWPVGFALLLTLLTPGHRLTPVAGVAAILALLALALLATRIGRGLGTVHRRLAARLLDERVPPPPPPRPPGRGVLGRLGAGLRDGPGWRAVAYQLLKLPAAVLASYAVFLWAAGLVNLTYPFWWGLFRNHPAGVTLGPVLAASPFPGRALHVATFAGTFAAFAVGAAMLLAAPWVTRAVVTADRWLLRGLLGPGRLAQRVRDLEQTRALAVDDAAARLRRVERDLHDGAQVHLATLAMHLGMAREQLGHDGDPLDVARARELLDAAHRGAKDALGELRDLARGIHPPALDGGLQDALATLAASSAIPVELRCDLPERPAPAIETIAYFCAAELLANAAKHSHAKLVTIRVAGQEGMLVLTVGDDGVGGADPARGSGLSGLAQRARTVDGRLETSSPGGGPTRITIQLPLRP